MIGWADDREAAYRALRGLRQAPGAIAGRIVDRHGAEPDLTLYFGVLR